MNKKKMIFTLEKDDNGYPPDDYETMWVEDLGENRYRVDNIPFYICDISPNDIVEGEIIDKHLFFRRILSRSNVSVIRIVFFDKSKSDSVMAELVRAGCRWEGSHLSNLYSIELPDSVNFQTIKNMLNEQASGDILDYEESSIRFV
jgi:Domain of unknown function (DUF4265)